MKRRLRTLALTAASAVLLSTLAWVAPAPTQGADVPDTVEEIVEVHPLLPAGSGNEQAPEGGGISARRDAVTEPATTCASFWFTGVALMWEQPEPEDVHVSIRTSADDGQTFSPRSSFDADGSHAPDPGTPEDATATNGSPLIWTGEARCVRWTMELHAGTSVDDVRVMFLNTSGTAEGPGSAPAEAADGGGFGVAGAQAWTPQPTILTRKDWGARESLNNCAPYYADSVKMAFVHHTVTANVYAKSRSDDILRAIHAYHTNGRGWCDIAYNFLIDRFGRTWEGRKGGIDLPVVSGATQGFNTGSASVALLGDFEKRRPPTASTRALRRLLAWRLDIAHVRPNTRTTMVSAGGDNTRYAAGRQVRLRTISGHRNTGYTACPGNHLYRQLDTIRKRVSKMGLPKIYNPTAEPFAIPQGSADPIRIKAAASTVVDWQVTIAASNGTVVKTLTATGEKLSVPWAGVDEASALVPVGPYDVTIAAQDGAAQARPAELRIRIRAPD